MATICKPNDHVSPTKSSGGVNVSKRQPRDERLRIPRKNPYQSTPTSVAPTPAVPLSRASLSSPRESSESSQFPGSPKVVEFQALSGAGRGTDDIRPWQCIDQRKVSHEAPRRQSQLSNVLEYYMHDHSPHQNLKTPSGRGAPAIAAFDLGLSDSKSSCQPPRPPRRSPPSLPISNGFSKDKALPTLPSQHTPTYSLFPSSAKVATMGRGTRPMYLPSNRSVPSTAQALPIGISIDLARPRKASLPSSVRSRADSCSSVQLVSSKSPDNALSHKVPRRPLPIRVSSCIPTSPLPAQPSQLSTPTPSRWSGDTITHMRDSTSSAPSTTKERISTSSSAFSTLPWPRMGSYFEDDDDDDEGVPLRKKMATRIRGARAWSGASASSSTALTVLSDATVTAEGRKDLDREREVGWGKRLMLCCASEEVSFGRVT